VFAILGIRITFFSHAAANQFPANIDYEGINSYGNYNPAALSNPNVGAVDISMNWGSNRAPAG
jgi:hypothetical protein